MPGPVPKRDDQRRRRNAPAGGAATSASTTSQVTVSPADEEWHPLARDWYDSLAQSGQSQFYEPTDWQQARVLARILDRLVRAEKPSPELFKAWQSGAAELLTTEGARRRVRVELVREQPQEKKRPSTRERLRAV